MTPEQWQRIKDILARASEIDPARREEYLKSACGDDSVVYEEAVSLLRYESGAKQMPSDEEPRRLAPITSGTRIKDRYVVERELGRGGFAVTYLATDEQLHPRRLVVKVMSRYPTLDGWYQRKFREEIRALSLLDHPGVVAPIDSGQLEDGTPFLVMQFVDGSTLRAMIKAGRLPVARAAAIVRQCGRVLANVHAKKVYHRDLKPDNIMVRQLDDGSDYVFLIDFGIASVLEGNPHSAVQTRVVGSLLYMAPEQLKGVAVRQTDVFGLAAVTYEMLCGVPPFPADNLAELLEAHRQKKIVRPRSLRPQLTAQAERLILQALEPEPQNRPGDPAQWAETLAAALEQEVPGGRTRRVTAIVAGLLTMLAILLGAVFFRSNRSVGVTAIPPIPAAQSTPDEPLSHFTATVALRTGGIVEVAHPLRLRGRDEFRVVVNSARDGHIYIYSEDLESGSLVALFPSRSANGGSSFVAAGQSTTVPESRYLQFGDKPGRDRLWIAWAPNPDPVLSEGIRWIDKATAGRVEDAALASSIRQVLQRFPVQPIPEANAFRVEGRSYPLVSAIEIDHR